MRKRVWCVVAAILLSAGAAHAQAPDTGGATLPQLPDVGPVMPPPTEFTEGSIPLAQLARTLADSDARIWANADYLFAWMRGSQPIPLATTSPSTTPRATAGVLGQPTTAVLFGNDRFGDDLRAGFRFATGMWFNHEQTLGVEAGFMMTSSQAGIFSAASGDGTIIARPFIDATTGLPQAVLVAFPGLSNGTLDIRANTGNLYGAYFDLTEKACDNGTVRIYSLFGYRFFRYDESLRVQQAISPLPGGAFVPGTIIFSNDNFSTRNQFHGLDLGFRTQFSIADNLTLEVLTKVAVGRLSRDIDIGGNQTSIVPGVDPVTRLGGVLALTTNATSFNDTDWRAIPELGATLGWQIRPSMTLRVGYSFLYFNAFARAADQVDPQINPHFLPGANAALGGPLRPAFNLIRSDLWLQSVNLGLEITY